MKLCFILLFFAIVIIVDATNNGADIAVCDSRSPVMGCPPSAWPLDALGRPQRLKCSVPGRIMAWASEAVQSRDHSVQFGPLGGTDGSTWDVPDKWTTFYVPDVFFEVRILTLDVYKRYHGILMYAVKAGTNERVGEWRTTDTEPRHLQPAGLCKATLLHAGSQVKPYRLVAHVRFPRGTGRVQFRVLLKAGEANTGAFYWPGESDPELDEGPVAATSSVPQALQTNVTWVRSHSGESCTAACSSAAPPGTLACAQRAIGLPGPLTDRRALQAIGVPWFGCSTGSFAVCSAAAPVQRDADSICFHSSEPACGLAGLAAPETFDCNAVAPLDYRRLCPCVSAASQPPPAPTPVSNTPPPTPSQTATESSSDRQQTTAASFGSLSDATCEPGTLGCRCLADGSCQDAAAAQLVCLDNTYCLADSLCERIGGITDRRGCLCALGNDESCGRPGLQCWAPKLGSLDDAQCVVAECHRGLVGCDCLAGGCLGPQAECVDGKCQSSVSCQPGTLGCECASSSPPCVGPDGTVQCVLSPVDNRRYCRQLSTPDASEEVEDMGNAPPPAPGVQSRADGGDTSSLIVGLAVAGVFLIVVLGLVAVWAFRKRSTYAATTDIANGNFYSASPLNNQQSYPQHHQQQRGLRSGHASGRASSKRRSLSVGNRRYSKTVAGGGAHQQQQQQHESLLGKGLPSLVVRPPLNTTGFSCAQCGQVYVSEVDLEAHKERRGHF